MSCEHLVCANCAGPVVDGRCASCRVARAELHHSGGVALTPQLVALLLALAALAMLLAAHVSGA